MFVTARDESGNVQTRAKILEFNPTVPEALDLTPGVYEVLVSIQDQWGAVTVFEMPGKVTVTNFF